MSKFFSRKPGELKAYVPGEQPRNVQQLIKLNTNESPFPPSPKAQEYAKKASENLQLYPDPECRVLTEKIAEHFGVKYENVLVTNGSDEILNFAFMAFCDKDNPCVFPDITYGFYTVFAEINNIPYTEIPLRDDFTINVEKSPATEVYSGRNVLSAKFSATAPDQSFLMRLKVNYGNDYGQGYSTDSKSSLFGIEIWLKTPPLELPESSVKAISVASVPEVNRVFSDFFPADP